MTKLPPDLEALMPEPAMQEDNPLLDLGKMDPYGGKRILFWYTADQVREAILAATERAAKVCEALQDHAEEKRSMDKFTAAQGRRVADAVARGNHWSTVNLFNTALRRAAAAIRSGGEGGL